MKYEDVLASFGLQGSWTVSEGQSGWNNTTRFMANEEGEKLVLRVYETHRDAGKVRFEHAVLRALNGADLPFAVPRPIAAPDGRTYVRLSDGTERLACAFPYLEGERPPERESGAAYAIGAAAAWLSAALADTRPDEPPAYPPYYELDRAYPLCTEERLEALCAAPPEALAAEAGRLRTLAGALRDIRAALPRLRELPHQLVHGDLNASNLLGTAERVTAVLDFEFCTRDARAMEIAVLVSGYVDEASKPSNGDELDAREDAGSEPGGDEIEPSLRLAEEALRSFGANRKLTPAEADAVPLLVRLRKLDVFLHFLSRYWDGVDGADVLAAQLRSAERGLARLDRVADRLHRACLTYLT